MTGEGAGPDELARVETLLQLVEAEAEGQLVRASPGAWADVTRRCRAARRTLDADPPCEPRWHIYFLELVLWGEVLAAIVLPERQNELVEALREAAALETPGDPDAWAELISMVHPGLRASASAGATDRGIRTELRAYQAIKAFRARPTVASLRTCLAIALEFQRVVAPGGAHRPCGPDTYLVGGVLADVLTERFPLVDRWALARGVEGCFFIRHGDEQPIGPGGIPHTLWTRLGKGQVVASVSDRLLLTGGEVEAPASGRWFVDEIEARVRQYDGWSWKQLMGWERRAGDA